MSTARSLLKQWGTLALDGRLPLARERREWVEAVIADAGGRDHLSRVEISLREGLGDEWLILRSIGLYIFGMESLVNRKRRSLHPIVMQYNQLSDSFSRRCHQLGVKRVPPPTPTLQDMIAKVHEKAAAAQQASVTTQQANVTPSPPEATQRVPAAAGTRDATQPAASESKNPATSCETPDIEDDSVIFIERPRR